MLLLLLWMWMLMLKWLLLMLLLRMQLRVLLMRMLMSSQVLLLLSSQVMMVMSRRVVMVEEGIWGDELEGGGGWSVGGRRGAQGRESMHAIDRRAPQLRRLRPNLLPHHLIQIPVLLFPESFFFELDQVELGLQHLALAESEFNFRLEDDEFEEVEVDGGVRELELLERGAFLVRAEVSAGSILEALSVLVDHR